MILLCFVAAVGETHTGCTIWMCSSMSSITPWPYMDQCQSCWPIMLRGPWASSGSMLLRPGWTSAPTLLAKYADVVLSYSMTLVCAP